MEQRQGGNIVDEMVFFAGWAGPARVVIVGTLAYVALVLLIRVSGKRSLSKMNAFDLVVTVALGSTLATVILSKDVALVEGVVAFGLLLGLQFGITWLSVRSASVRRLVKAEPTLLLYQGSILPEQLKRSRVLEDEVYAAIRGQGIAALSGVEAVVLETDGSFGVVSRTEGPATSLRGVSGGPQDRNQSSAT
jgi:uncharacterized membrane protein YcaP (DUF421 family)